MENDGKIIINKNDPLSIAEYIVSVLDAKKAGDIKLLHVSDKTIITDYMIVCSGNSATQIRSLGDEVEFRMEQAQIEMLHNEGEPSGGWVLLDYGCVLVHIFNKEARNMYNLERLYQGGDEVDISGLIEEN